jgi:hypothetical protein
MARHGSGGALVENLLVAAVIICAGLAGVLRFGRSARVGSAEVRL